MTLQEAIAKIETTFGKIGVEADLTVKYEGVPYVFSGGTAESETIAPALYISEEMAVDTWFSTITAYIRANLSAGRILKWADKPELIRMNITMMNPRQMHRITNDRFTVRSRVVLVGAV